MTAIAALTLMDGQATPVSHTFSPVNIDQSGVARWADRSGGVAIGYPVMSFGLRAPSKTSRNYRMLVKMVLPVLEQTSASTSTGIQPAPTKAYDLTFTGEFILPERSTLLQRSDLLAYAKNALAHAIITEGVKNFESVY